MVQSSVGARLRGDVFAFTVKWCTSSHAIRRLSSTREQVESVSGGGSRYVTQAAAAFSQLQLSLSLLLGITFVMIVNLSPSRAKILDPPGLFDVGSEKIRRGFLRCHHFIVSKVA